MDNPPVVQKVQIVAVHLGFWNMVSLFIMAALAAIPAMIILTAIYFVAAAALVGVFAGLARH